MWGSSFADLAKKAQEQAAAAASTVSSPSITSNFSGAAGLFNLDSMQADDDNNDTSTSTSTRNNNKNASDGSSNNRGPSSQNMQSQSAGNLNVSASTSANTASTAPASLTTPVNLNSLSYGFSSPATPLVTPVKPKSSSGAKLVIPAKNRQQQQPPSTKRVTKLQMPTKAKGAANTTTSKPTQPSSSATKLAIPRPVASSSAPSSSKSNPKPALAAPAPANGSMKGTATVAPSKSTAAATDKEVHTNNDQSKESKISVGIDGIPPQNDDGSNSKGTDGWGSAHDAPDSHVEQVPHQPMLDALDKGSIRSVGNVNDVNVNDQNMSMSPPTLDQLPPQKSNAANDQPKFPPPSLDQLDRPAKQAKSVQRDPIVQQPPPPSLEQLPPQPNDDAPSSAQKSSIGKDAVATKEAKNPSPSEASLQEHKTKATPQTPSPSPPPPTTSTTAANAPFIDLFSGVTTDTFSNALGNAVSTASGEALQTEASSKATDATKTSAAPSTTNATASATTARSFQPKKVSPAPASAGINATITPTTDADSIPDHILEQFTKQLERLEQNHETEKLEYQQNFQYQLQQQKEQWKLESIQMVQQAEKSVKEQMKGKLEREFGRTKENLQLRIESLEHELEGTRALVDQRDKAKSKTQDSHLNELRAMESQMMAAEEAGNKSKERIKELEQQLEETNGTIATKEDEYETLKERVKAVAGELKDRRIECRTLQSEVGLLKQSNAELQDEITQLQAQGMDKDKSQTEVSDELNKLRAELMDRQRDLETARAAIKEVESKGETALATYKKKAQSSLSVANSRIASAVQAKEEAELEARAARASADTAMDRVVKAESEARQKMAEAKLQVKHMTEQLAAMESVEAKLKAERAESAVQKSKLNELQASYDALESKNEELAKQMKSEGAGKAALAKSLGDTEDRCNELMDEVDRLSQERNKLREDLKRSNAEKKRLSEQQAEKGKDGYSVPSLSSAADVAAAAATGSSNPNNSEAESTITMLRQELQVADQAIRDLKQTLRVTIEERDQAVLTGGPPQNGGAGTGTGTGTGSHAVDNGGSRESSGAEAVPLFYAMEKQAELTQARNEISRLAGLVGDAKAEKQEALDQVAAIQEELHQVQSRVQRMEQLGGRASNSTTMTATTTASSTTPTNGSQNGSDASKSTSDGSLNLEYLKNIVLSYLNAKTKQERRTLLPVIGTVLCLTPEEQAKAMERLSTEDAQVVNAVANSLLTKFSWSG
mmetsp:Transcript_27456/g.76982  ORF Transcript_27456/g.76982 Transcript_27456/m.76982 type:complete len:1235 (-) Transcript_27456:115-3819(-)